MLLPSMTFDRTMLCVCMHLCVCVFECGLGLSVHVVVTFLASVYLPKATSLCAAGPGEAVVVS